MPIEKFDLILDHAEKIAPNALHMAFRRQDGKPLDYLPGQFVTFLLDNNGELKRRSYSISTIPGQSELIEIALTYVKGGIASERLFNMKPGDCLPAMGPAGRLIMADDPDKSRYVLVATSTGVSPYRAMLPDLAKRLKARPDFSVELLLGVQYRADLLYDQDFLDFAKQHEHFRFHAHLSREDLSKQSQAHEKSGHVQTGFDALKLDPKTDVVYLCGNPDMIDEAFQQLVEKGFATKDIRREKYISSR